jgi:hypothetical protein
VAVTSPNLGTPTSDEYWTVDGVSLHTNGWAVQTVGGTRYSVPPLRGDDAVAAWMPGETWLPKVPGPRVISLPMFLIGVDPADGSPVEDPRLRWNDSWAFLRQTFWNPDAQFVLGRRWWRTDPVSHNPGIAYAEALGQLAPGTDLQPQMTGRTRATFNVDVKLAHPFFYGPAQAATVNPGQSVTVTNPGDWTAFSRHLYIDFVGPLYAPKLTCTTAAGQVVYCAITGSVAAGETLTLDVGQYVALSARATISTRVNRTGEIVNAGTRSWLALGRGPNTLTLTGTGGGGAVVRFRPPYL